VMAKDDMTLTLVESIAVFPFEIRKELLGITISLLGAGGGLEENIASQIGSIFNILTQNYNQPELAMICGQFLRDLASSGIIQLNLLTMNTFQTLIRFSFSETFEISSDAFETFKLLLSNPARFVIEFVNLNFAELLEMLYSLINTDNYFLKRSALSLYIHLLNVDSGFASKVLTGDDNLKFVMNLLKDENSI
jgi:calcium binding protein 39